MVNTVSEEADAGEICEPQSLGPVLFPEARTMQSGLDLCRKMRGKMVVVRGEAMQRELIDIYDEAFPPDTRDSGNHVDIRSNLDHVYLSSRGLLGRLVGRGDRGGVGGRERRAGPRRGGLPAVVLRRAQRRHDRELPGGVALQGRLERLELPAGGPHLLRHPDAALLQFERS